MSAAAAGLSAPAGQGTNPNPAGGDAGGAGGGGATDASGTHGAKPTASTQGDAGAGGKKDGEPGSATGGSKDGKPGEASVLELKLPQGLKGDEPLLSWFKPLAQELGLGSEPASKLVAGYAEWAAKETEARDKADLEGFRQQGAAWEKELADDKDFGGAKLPETMADVNRFLTDARYGGAKAAEVLKGLGLQSHPDLVRTFALVGRALRSDSSITETSRNGAATSLEDRARKEYPSMGPGKAAVE